MDPSSPTGPPTSDVPDTTPGGGGGEGSPAGIILPGGHDELGPLAFMHSVPLVGHSGPAVPDPMAEALRSRIAEQRARGEWESWFVDLPEQQDEYASLIGAPTEGRETAARNLRELYPPKVCLRMLKHPQDRGVIEGLFNRWLPFVIPLVRLGMLLETAQPWSDRKLLADLRSHEGFASAYTELEIWAALTKARFRIDREPLGPAGRRPDFAVYTGNLRYFVEVKKVLRSDGERLAEELRLQMSAAAQPLIGRGRTARVSATPTLRDLLDSAEGRQKVRDSMGEEALASLREEAERLATTELPPGRYPCRDWFTIEIDRAAEDSMGSLACGVWDGLEEERRAVRVASVVESALGQIPATHPGVVVVDVGEAIDTGSVAGEMSQRIAEHPILFSPLRFVALRWSVTVGLRTRIAGAPISNGGPLTPAEAHLASVLLG